MVVILKQIYRSPRHFPKFTFAIKTISKIKVFIICLSEWIQNGFHRRTHLSWHKSKPVGLVRNGTSS